MKKYLKCILLLLTVTYYGNTQWVLQRPLPTAEDLNESQFLDANTGFVAGDYGIFMKTTNGGANWIIKEQVNGTIEDFSSLFFLNTTTGWIGGSKIYKTTNQGLTWVETVILGNTILTNIHFTDENTGYISGNSGVILKTSDGGLNWGYLTNCYNSNRLFFANANTFWAASFQNSTPGYYVSNLKKTTNAGVSWVNQFDASDHWPLANSVFFLNDLTGWLSGGNGLRKTTNGGNNWISISSQSGNRLFFLNENQGFMLQDVRILYTSNSGYTWSDSHNFGEYTLSLTSINSNEIFLSGEHGLLTKTTNSGINWIEFSEGVVGSFYDVFFADSNTGWFVGRNSTLQKTTNRGSSFVSQFPGVVGDYNRVFFMNQNTGWICGDHLVLKTTNGGSNWVPLNNTAHYFQSIYFVNENTGWLTGNAIGSYLWKTTDGGTQWQQIPLAQPDIGTQTDINFININTGFVTGYYGIQRTSNGGLNWEVVSSVGNLRKIQVVDYNNIFFLSSASVWKSTDAGITWNMIFTGGPAPYFTMFFTNQYTGYLPGYYERVMLKTTDGGNTWGQQPISTMFVRGIFFINNSLGWVCSSNGNIFMTTNGGGNITGISQTNEMIPCRPWLFQNYPNPFNPQTKIKFAVPKASFTKIIIYDLMGREVATLVNEELKPGTYEAD